MAIGGLNKEQMRFDNFTKLQEEMEKSKPKGVYFLFSTEFFSLSQVANELVHSILTEELLGFNFNEFDGSNFTVDDLQNCLNTLPVISSCRVVLIKNLCYFEVNAAVLKKLKEIAANLPETSILIITSLIENFDFSKQKKFELWLSEFSKTAKVFDCSFSSNRQLFNFFSKFVEAQGNKISFANFNFLIDRVSRNWQIVSNELAKLCSYAHGREILKGDILELTKINLNSTAFELADAILSLNLEKALLIFKNLVEADVSLFLIVGAINSCFVDLLRVSVCSQAGLTNEQISEIFNYRGCAFKLKNARKFVKGFNAREIKRCIKILVKLDLNLKFNRMNGVALIENALTEMAKGS